MMQNKQNKTLVSFDLTKLNGQNIRHNVVENSVSARKKGEGDLGVFSVEDFATMVNDEVANMLKEI